MGENSAWQSTWDIWLSALDNTWRELVEAAGALVPGLIGAVLVLLGGWLIAIVLRKLIFRFGAGLDRMFALARDRLGLFQLELRWPISRIIGHSAFWLVIVFFLAAASDVLGLPGLVDIFTGLLLDLPLLLVWGAVAFALYVASGVAGGAVTGLARASGLANAVLLGRLTRIGALLFAGIIVASQLGIDVTLLVNVVTIVVAVLFGGAALAFGIGAGGITGNLIAAHYVRQNYRVGQRVAIGELEGEILEITRSMVVLDCGKGRSMVPARLFNEQASLLLEADE
ncbi:MAG: hypothetical protein OXF43_01060 [Gammaproteobacteria bacterium]|nr:hypothetical protein [Gammaproteobacteria bacterium]MCY4296499.1 hypothetical protein [Gammaproteobacteria bacterium]